MISANHVVAEDATSNNQSVSQSNFKAGVLAGGGASGTEDSVAATGLWATPVGDKYGIQLEALAGGTNNHATFGATGHFFKRDPSYGILGLYGSANYGRINYGDGKSNAGSGQGIGRLGIEGARYFNNFTFGGVLGAERDYQAEQSSFFDKLGVDYFFTPNLKGSAFHQYTGKRHGGGLGFELLANPTSDTPISLYGEVMDGKDSVLTYSIGARVLFGATTNRSLQERDRNDYVHNIAPRTMARKLTKTVAAAGPAARTSCTPPTAAEQAQIDACGAIPVTIAPFPSCAVSCIAFSDRRLKKEIVLLATLENGIHIYAFKYLWSDEVFVGVMAQDLLAMPAYKRAAILTKSGFYVVDYAALGLTMITFAQWQQSPESIFAAIVFA